MVWLLPAALAGLTLLAGPLALHLLTRHRARRLPFPTLRFVPPSNTAAVRLRQPTDVWLLILRLAIVAFAVAACAQPLFVTSWRLAGWNGRVARAIVIDSSPSMTLTDGPGRVPADLAAEIARAEETSAFQATRLDAADVNEGLTRATRLLDAMPPARREIVVISDFQQQVLDPRALAAIPKEIGLRFVRAGTAPSRREWTGQPMSGWRGDRWEPTTAIDGTSTTTVWRRAPTPVAVQGLSISTAHEEEQDVRIALRAAEAFGVPSTPTDTRVALALDGARLPPSFEKAHEIRSRAGARLLESLRANELLAQASKNVEDPTDLRVSAPWTPMIRDSRGRTLVAAAEADGEVLVRAATRAPSIFATALIRALLLSRDVAPAPDQEVNQIRDVQLDSFRREPGPVTPQSWPRADRTDARWFWTAALVLLLTETWIRGRATPRRREDAHVQAA